MMDKLGRLPIRRHEKQSYFALSAARASFSFGTVVSYAFWISAGLDIVLPEMTFVVGLVKKRKRGIRRRESSKTFIVII